MTQTSLLRDFAAYLKRDRLQELAAEQLRRAMALKVPILRQLAHLSEAELLEWMEADLASLLDALYAGELRERMAGRLCRRGPAHDPGILEELIEPGDLVLFFAARRQALTSFVPGFAPDSQTAVAIVLALDADLTRVQEAACRVFTRRKGAKDRFFQFDLLVKSVVDYAIFMLDPMGFVLTWNEGAKRLKGYRAGEIIGRSHERFYTPEAIHAGLPRELLKAAEARGHVVDVGWRVRKDASRFWAEVVITAVRDDEGHLLGFAKVTRDLTERRQAELEAAEQIEALKQADRYKDEFLSVISHELRTPLNFIMGFGSILQDELAGKLNAEQHEYVGKMLTGAERMLAQVKNLLDMSQMAAGAFRIAPSETRYEPVVDEAVSSLKPLAAQKGIALECDVQVPRVVCIDGQRIIQVLGNLVENGIKFTPAGGKIRIAARLEEGSLLTEVADTGEGIDAEAIPRLFKRFQQLDMSTTREAGGIGLGLSISKTIVDAHGGTIGVRSEKGKGSTFWYRLPVGEC
ncbi:MAG TPA: PAS domain-containing sensor histidine kinase [Pantanalinema sp.]